MTDEAPPPPILPLGDAELRVVMSLVEKQATVPESYPLTLNALRSACNQSTSRFPVVAYDERTVMDALDSLKARKVLRFVHPGAGARTTRYRHVLDEALDLAPDELALLAVLALRGPQAPGELRTRAERLHAFASLAEVEEVLERLAGRDQPLAVHLPRQPGQKEARWAHLLSGPDAVVVEAASAAPAASGSSRSSVDPDRIERLEREVATLRRQLAQLYEAIGEDLPGL
ncbi:MAG TPA: YceH family protein [Acidimicrobiales bacterium]|nr:YceH family protein [Acidimicrobiales bacterium]